jgi:hypothetical protein
LNLKLKFYLLIRPKAILISVNFRKRNHENGRPEFPVTLPPGRFGSYSGGFYCWRITLDRGLVMEVKKGKEAGISFASDH